ncbi:hypothetical protein IT568_12650 [bacterium]|nr:hypothetical protein [bacterium]
MKNTEDLLIVDAGNMLFRTEGITEQQKEEWSLKAELVMEIQNQIGLDAANVGVRDLTNGLAYLKEKSLKYKIPFVSSNLLDAKTQQLVFSEFGIIEVSGLKVGIFGITQGFNTMPKNVDWSLKDYKTVTPEVVSKLKAKKCEIIVLLANVQKPQLDSLLTANPEINFAVASGNQEQTFPQTIGEAKVFGTRDRSRAVSFVEIGKVKKSAEKKFVDLTSTEIAYKQFQERDKLNPGTEEIKKELEKLSAQIEDTRKNKNFYKTELFDLDTKIPDNKDVKQKVDAVTKKIAEIAQQQKLVQGIDKNRLFVGQTKCAECHTKQYNFWMETSHAKAYKTLEKEEKQFSLACVGCHVTGWEEKGGVSDPKQVEGLKDVQCESCHGAGKSHLLTSREDVDAKRKTITKVPAESSCVKCHTKEQTEGFNFPVHKQLIACPSGF